jgi:hypothetical protein
MPGFMQRDGTFHPAIIFCEGSHWRNDIGVLETNFNVDFVRRRNDQEQPPL